MSSGAILIVDDDIELCKTIEKYLKIQGFSPSWVNSASEAMALIHRQTVNAVLTDLRMPVENGLDLCVQVMNSQPDIPVIIMTAFGDLETAIQAIRVGAYDFVTKPIEMELLTLVLSRAIKFNEMKGQINLLKNLVARQEGSDDVIYGSEPMRAVMSKLNSIAAFDVSVLITGESGTGKELVARVIHEKSDRNSGPFIPVNCSALPEVLLESELFGHVKGAFTDAKKDRKGLFLSAAKGTIFLDEIGELPISLQPKILRALEDRKIRPVGSDNEIPIDARVISATNSDLESEIAEGNFREDLFYRINTVNIDLPPLRQRGFDIAILARHFTKEFAERFNKKVIDISDAALERLLVYPWKGNVRELKNALQSAIILTRHDKLVLEDFPEIIRTFASSDYPTGENCFSQLSPMSEVERQYIEFVMKKMGGNKKEAAKILGFDRKTLYRKLNAYESGDTNRDPE